MKGNWLEGIQKFTGQDFTAREISVTHVHNAQWFFFRNMDLQYATKSVHSEKTASSSCQWAFKWHLLPTRSLPISNRLRSDLVIVIICFFIRRLGTNVTGSFLCYYSNGICFSLKEIYKHIFKSSMLLRNVSLSKGCSFWCVPFKKSEKKPPNTSKPTLNRCGSFSRNELEKITVSDKDSMLLGPNLTFSFLVCEKKRVRLGFSFWRAGFIPTEVF